MSYHVYLKNIKHERNHNQYNLHNGIFSVYSVSLLVLFDDDRVFKASHAGKMPI